MLDAGSVKRWDAGVSMVYRFRSKEFRAPHPMNFSCAEVVADGHIHIYAPLRGKAIAGARGDENACIFATCLEAELLSIAGTYRTSEVPLPPEVRSKAARVRLQRHNDAERLLIEAIA